jgi:uncharacterized membrane protein
MNTLHKLPNQERIAGALAYILFFIPFLMKVKTDFTMFHAKQSLIMALITFIVSFIPFIGWIFHIVIMITVLWCAYQAFLGNKFIIPVL